MERYILTGAPGAGKTAIIRQLETDGYTVIEEAATDVIALWQAKGIAKPWTHPGFIGAIVALQQRRERRAADIASADGVQFYDRSVVCTAALAEYLRVPRPQNLVEELRRVTAEHTYQRNVLFLRHLGFITHTNARKITYEEAVRFEQIHEKTYRDLAFAITYIETGSVSDRLEQIKQILSMRTDDRSATVTGDEVLGDE
jgi:predicted ATPase